MHLIETQLEIVMTYECIYINSKVSVNVNIGLIGWTPVQIIGGNQLCNKMAWYYVKVMPIKIKGHFKKIKGQLRWHHLRTAGLIRFAQMYRELIRNDSYEHKILKYNVTITKTQWKTAYDAIYSYRTSSRHQHTL